MSRTRTYTSIIAQRRKILLKWVPMNENTSSIIIKNLQGDFDPSSPFQIGIVVSDASTSSVRPRALNIWQRLVRQRASMSGLSLRGAITCSSLGLRSAGLGLGLLTVFRAGAPLPNRRKRGHVIERRRDIAVCTPASRMEHSWACTYIIVHI